MCDCLKFEKIEIIAKIYLKDRRKLRVDKQTQKYTE